MEKMSWKHEKKCRSEPIGAQRKADPLQLQYRAEEQAMLLIMAACVAFTTFGLLLLIVAVGFGCPSPRAGDACSPDSTAKGFFDVAKVAFGFACFMLVVSLCWIKRTFR